MLTELYEQENGQMQVAGFMSGSGTNLRKIIEHERRIEVEQGRAPYHVAIIFSDNSESNATKIGKEYDLPVIVRDIQGFYKAREKPKKDLKIRQEFDSQIVEILKHFNIAVVAYAGYMSIATSPLVNSFLGVNVHPADLSVMNGDKRKYTGSNAVRDAILAGERFLRSSTHIIEERVDYGRILMISHPLEIVLNETNTEHQNRLKEVGDWIIFPKTLEYLADGRYSQDGQGNLHFDGKPIPNGLKLE